MKSYQTNKTLQLHYLKPDGGSEGNLSMGDTGRDSKCKALHVHTCVLLGFSNLTAINFPQIFTGGKSD